MSANRGSGSGFPFNRRSVMAAIGGLWATASVTATCNLAQAQDVAVNFPVPVFPLSTRPGLRHPIDAAGKPFMMHGDSAWSLIAQLNRKDASDYLEDRKARGFNTVLVNLIEHKFATHAPANIYGDPPFMTPGDFSTPYEKYFAHADWILGKAEELGIMVLLAPCYAGAGGGGEGWYKEMVANGPDAMLAYGRYVGARFKHLSNIVWVECGDYAPPNRKLVRQLVAGIRETNPTALHTVHCSSGVAGLDYWPDEDWLSLNTVYVREHINEITGLEYRRSDMPVFFIEGTYENEDYGGPPANELGLRRQAFYAVLSGAFGHVFGNNPIWHFDARGLFKAPTDWREALSSRGSQTMTHVRSILEAADWANLQPDLQSRFVGAGHGAGEDRAVAALTADRKVAVVYLPSSREIEIDLGRMSGPNVTLRWYDPSNGVYTPAAEAPVPSGARVKLKPSGANSSNFDDWVLVARSVN
ncbi:MAG: DUF4038 domain-containing protein [Alphaproteobacteria bacterium]|nr:DUF4038 domain-containing protein [Alphaproteobacteria bacterium]